MTSQGRTALSTAVPLPLCVLSGKGHASQASFPATVPCSRRRSSQRNAVPVACVLVDRTVLAT